VLDKSVAVTYINALLDTAKSRNELNRLEEDLKTLSKIMAKYESFVKVLVHPSITRKEKKDTIKKIFGDVFSKRMQDFLNLLVDRRKEKVLEFVPEIFRKVLDEKKGIIRAKVQTAIPIVGERREHLKSQLNKITGKDVEVEVSENPEILGGLLIEIGNRMIDGSVLNRLKNLRSRLLELHTA